MSPSQLIETAYKVCNNWAEGEQREKQKEKWRQTAAGDITRRSRWEELGERQRKDMGERNAQRLKNSPAPFGDVLAKEAEDWQGQRPSVTVLQCAGGV